jgi:ADP-ribose pyrophosphatase YjhB (NUDIX family)
MSTVGGRHVRNIVDTPNGILLVSETGKRFSLPGGGTRHHESRESAAIRELEESFLMPPYHFSAGSID